MFLEAINHVLALWTTEAPYNLKGKYWSITTERTAILEIGQGSIPKPLQKPHPPIIVAVTAPFSKGVTEAAARGWDPLSANFLMPQWVKSHWPKYVEGCARGGRRADPANWRVARSIFVADDEATARAYVSDAASPYRQYYASLSHKVIKGGRGELFKASRDMPDSALTLDYICDNLVIWGSPAKVIEKILAFRETTGDFGSLYYAGHDWRDPALARRSMVLMAEKVLPALNAAIA
jgi:alkanesulfonate monooxygenase SsuD/methylene tetrahydromethanopterin reductase-like flavin-dependent oxidoreductase (luciferase family)